MLKLIKNLLCFCYNTLFLKHIYDYRLQMLFRYYYSYATHMFLKHSLHISSLMSGKVISVFQQQKTIERIEINDVFSI